MLVESIVRCLRSSSNLHAVTSSHATILKMGDGRASSFNHLIHAYVRCDGVPEARKLFDEMPERNVVSWTSLMAGYVRIARPEGAIFLFLDMNKSDVLPNAFTYSTAVNACSHLADLAFGRAIHARSETCGIRSDLVVSSALVNMYSKSNKVDDARRIFDRMTERNAVSWGSMISAYAQNARGHEALALFGEFLRSSSSMHLLPNHFMFSSVVNACATVGRLGLGRSAHASIVRHGYASNEVIAGALIDMYSKCGSIDLSRKAFDHIAQPSLVPYTSMIVAAAKYGFGKHSLELFDEMIDRGVKPNSITLLGVLHACNHCGFVDIGLLHLKTMRDKHGITPSIKHYASIVDMLGRAGRIDEAYELSKHVIAEGDDALILWSSLLSSCRTHRRLDIAVEAGKRLAEFDRDVSGAYVAMSNAFVAAGQLEGAARVRVEMSKRGIKKDPACSWVEIKDVIYVFYTGEVSSAGARKEEVMELLKELGRKMWERGYVGRNGWELDGVDDEGEEGKGVMVGVHSEKLALGFGLVSIPEGMTIRVMKNLRMCNDCHEAFKLISDIVKREIVVRDLNRFHLFRNGSCTCGDYWNSVHRFALLDETLPTQNSVQYKLDREEEEEAAAAAAAAASYSYIIKELDESQLELLDRLRGLRQLTVVNKAKGIQGKRRAFEDDVVMFLQDIQSWTSEMETQAKACENEIFELKRRLNSELDQQRPMSAAPEIAEEIKDQGKLSTENAQASSQDGMDKNKSTDLRWRMMLYKVKALATRVT
ncbi:hypothetical protein Cni_G24521 [Canna indica]|uniref:DYW domain-containing protein n=1 Tax=Canna indica TaxID=4628 RepID=A0AAQ3KWB0_9LILI|nr:hypothetical protein Cni_G24521 [Canna indica]